jgi:hypothetical protein
MAIAAMREFSKEAGVMENDIFECSVRTAGDLAVVFECDGEGGYFYLFDLTKAKGQEARAVIAVSERGEALDTSDVAVRWNASEEIGWLSIDGKPWAAFDQYGRRCSSLDGHCLK